MAYNPSIKQLLFLARLIRTYARKQNVSRFEAVDAIRLQPAVFAHAHYASIAIDALLDAMPDVADQYEAKRPQTKAQLAAAADRPRSARLTKKQRRERKAQLTARKAERESRPFHVKRPTEAPTSAQLRLIIGIVRDFSRAARVEPIEAVNRLRLSPYALVERGYAHRMIDRLQADDHDAHAA